MKAFMDKDFLLQTDTARRLFGTVEELPIIDYHCHLNPAEIADNKRFANLTEIWLGGDHYKWRAMRSNGVDERYITGDAPDYEKFLKWAETIPNLIGHPLYHWTHLELQRFFDYHGILSPKTAPEVWELCNAKLAEESFSVAGILDRFKVEKICTTDDPADTLEHHIRIAQEGKIKTQVLPTYRPGNAMNIENPGWAEYIAKLSKVSGIAIDSYRSVVKALEQRCEYFHANGCRLSDHALDPPVFARATEEDLNAAVKAALSGKAVDTLQANQFKTAILIDLAQKYHALGWVMQLHMGALRNTNTVMFNRIGADTGYDCMDDAANGRPLISLLDGMLSAGGLPKTILYCLNPKDNYLLASAAGCFQDGVTAGKIQFGSGWWFNDNKEGMEQQMTALATQGVLARFVGMLTDSRSFLSYPRHEYFRRILCNLIGNWVENGEYPADFDALESIVRGISYTNAKEYF